MTSTTAPSLNPHHQQHRICRISRSPVVLLCIALAYSLTIRILGDADQSTPVTLRGSSAVDEPDNTAAREAASAWEPEQQDRVSKFSYDTSRGPVKGGVEIYPVQPARRPRKAPLPIVPDVAEVEGVLTAWKMPGLYYEGGGEAIKGLYVVFHGCKHGPLDWFDLPEERAIVHFLVKMGYAVVAPASKDRVSGCWQYNSADGDVGSVKAMLWRWYRDWSIPPNTPLFLFGVSSGGHMATLLGSQGGFQLCEKRTTYVQVSGVMSQVSWGVDPINYGMHCPPLAFMPMPKGEPTGGENEVDNVPSVFGNSRKIPPRISSIAHQVRKSGGKPRMLLLPLGELSIYKGFFSDRVYEISVKQSAQLHAALLAARTLECDPSRLSGGEVECFLNKNPRSTLLPLQTLVATYEASVRGSDSAPPIPKESETQTAGDPEDPNERGLAMFQPSAGAYRVDPLSKGTSDDLVPKAGMTKDHATEVFRELLNVAWGAHEVSADFVALWEPWLWASCGNRCRPGPWR